uniref:C1q domain-containing protein n=1 Tax=Kalanchoe fedtschenkoi TaxID=63787 RepID=A0A7N0RI30_KALFE
MAPRTAMVQLAVVLLLLSYESRCGHAAWTTFVADVRWMDDPVRRAARAIPQRQPPPPPVSNTVRRPSPPTPPPHSP